MSLENEIRSAARDIVKDGYEMSLGELMSLYKQEEMIINPAYQRYFRWSPSQKSRFIESILLGIPFPPIFVFQTESGVWELIDGLQRLSTVFEFAGILVGANGEAVPPSVLEGTKLLPSLAGIKWQSEDPNDTAVLSKSQQLEIRRARIRVEILRKESDPNSKYELFQRLNTGGSSLTEQEIRNCVLIMINEDFYRWLDNLAQFPAFLKTMPLSENQLESQKLLEYVLRFVIYLTADYTGKLDVHDYLDSRMIELASDSNFDRAKVESVFNKTFDLLSRALGDTSFKRHDGSRFMGNISISAFEAIAVGIAKNIDFITQNSKENQLKFVVDTVVSMWQHPTFKQYSGAGVRGTTRLLNLLPWSQSYFDPRSKK